MSLFVIVIETQLPVKADMVSFLNGSNLNDGVVAEQELYTA
jgi:hypothetical protein